MNQPVTEGIEENGVTTMMDEADIDGHVGFIVTTVCNWQKLSSDLKKQLIDTIAPYFQEEHVTVGGIDAPQIYIARFMEFPENEDRILFGDRIKVEYCTLEKMMLRVMENYEPNIESTQRSSHINYPSQRENGQKSLALLPYIN